MLIIRFITKQVKELGVHSRYLRFGIIGIADDDKLAVL